MKGFCHFLLSNSYECESCVQLLVHVVFFFFFFFYLCEDNRSKDKKLNQYFQFDIM